MELIRSFATDLSLNFQYWRKFYREDLKYRLYQTYHYLLGDPPEEVQVSKAEIFNWVTLFLIEVPMSQLPKRVKNNNNLTHIYCSLDGLLSIEGLPNNLIILSCEVNNLTTLPELPPNLQQLYCHDNALTALPELPPTLNSLGCQNNKLTKLPVLPPGLINLTCYGNSYLYISREIATRFGITETPNYSNIMFILEKMRNSQKRYKKLKYCSVLEDHIDEFRFRPYNGGYYEMISQNKNKYSDTKETLPKI
jgi:Leucine-rich repeat (LRR) protein